MKIFYFLILFVFYIKVVQAQTKKIDSLENMLKLAKVDTNKVNLMNSLAFDYIFHAPEKAEIMLQNAVKLSQKAIFAKGEAEAYNLQAQMYRIKGIYEQALNLHFQSLKICEKINYQQGIAYNLGNVGIVYSEQENYQKAVEYYLKALKIKEILKDTVSISFTLNDIASAYLKLENYEKSLEYNFKALKINEILKSKGGMAYGLLNIGNVYYLTQKYEESEKALLKSETLAHETQNYYVEVQTTNILANLYEILKKYALARDYALKSIEIARQRQMKKDIKNAAFSLAKIYAKLNDFTNAYHYQNLFIAYKDSLQSLDMEKKTALIASQYEYGRKEDLLRAEHAQQIAEQRWIIFSVIIGFLVMIVIAFLILNSRRKLQKTYKNLEEANQEILQQKEEINQQKEEILLNLVVVEQQSMDIHKKNQDFKNSVTYALRIQNAILPSISEIQKHFPENFIFFMPRDIVSGDFYWFADKGNVKIMAVADCTGHGVSGAFMTMIGNNILNQIVNDYEIYEPDMILNLMPSLLAKTLSNAEKQVKDGMDISIVSIYKKDETFEKLAYSGAMNPFYYIQNQEFIEIKADKVPIGGRKDYFEYQKHEILLHIPTTFYLCSDGFQDQFGGLENKKFMVKRLKKLLLQISEKPILEQGKILENTLFDWIDASKEKQTDDILILGIKI